MWSRFRKFFQPPVFPDPELSRRAQNLQIILYGLFVATGLWAWYPIFVQGGIQIAVALIVIAIEVGIFTLVKIGKVQLAGSLISIILWFALASTMVAFGGIRNSGFVTFSIVIVVAGLTISGQASIIFAFLTIALGIVLVLFENQGMLPAYAYEPSYTILISNSMNMIGVSLLLFLAIRNINKAMQNAEDKEQSQKEINEMLEASHQELQQRTDILEQRNVTLQTVTEVAKLTSKTKSEITLLEQAAQLLANNIGLDYVRIYLLDQTEENAILKASNNMPGLIAFQENLKVTRNELGFPVFSTNVQHYQVGGYNYHIQRPSQLPETKNNFTLPLIGGDRLFGIINIQTISPFPTQFDEQTLQTFADQIALSIENIRLFEQLETRVREISILAGQTTQMAWDKIRGGETIGYNYDRLQVIPFKEALPADVSAELKKGNSATYITSDEPACARLVAPIILRENVIGVIGYEEIDPQHLWQESEKTLLETVASRVSLALENSRLVAEAERRAEQERALSQAANRMRETLDIDSILKTAAVEIKRTLNAEKTEVRLHIATKNDSLTNAPGRNKDETHQ